MRKLFDISIDDKLYPVFDIENKEHDQGRWNGSPTTWWLLYEDINVENKLIDETFDELNLIPFIDKGVHRICWEINYKQYNNIVYKYNTHDLRNGGLCTMRANGRDVYKFHSSDLLHAMSNVSVIAGKLISHPYNFFEPEKDDGRKIFFCGLPAFVYQGNEVGEIKIKPDFDKISPKNWWEKYDFYNFNERDWRIDFDFEPPSVKDEQKLDFFNEDDYTNRVQMINWGDALSDGKIWWFRE